MSVNNSLLVVVLAQAVLMGASTPESYVWTGTLEDLGHAPIPEDSDAPGTLVIGEVVSVASSVQRLDCASERSISWSR